MLTPERIANCFGIDAVVASHPTRGCPRLAIMIKRYLERLAANPDTDPLVRGTSVQLIEQYWAAAAVSALELLRHTQTGAKPAPTPVH